jgi:hypothetical protein
VMDEVLVPWHLYAQIMEAYGMNETAKQLRRIRNIALRTGRAPEVLDITADAFDRLRAESKKNPAPITQEIVHLEPPADRGLIDLVLHTQYGSTRFVRGIE